VAPIRWHIIIRMTCLEGGEANNHGQSRGGRGSVVGLNVGGVDELNGRSVEFISLSRSLLRPNDAKFWGKSKLLDVVVESF
jgi:hypothetical protein